MCGFITPLEGSEADEHRKPEVEYGLSWHLGLGVGAEGTARS